MPLSSKGLSNNAFKQQIAVYLQNAGHVLSLSFLPQSSRILLCEQQLQCQAKGWQSCRAARAYIPVDPNKGTTHPGSVSHISLFMPLSFHPSAPTTGWEPAQYLPSVTWPRLIHGSSVYFCKLRDALAQYYTYKRQRIPCRCFAMVANGAACL